MELNPLITVLMPCYNAEKYLCQALESIIEQTYKNLEILCINDGSTDNTSNILEKYAKKDCRIRIVNNEENLKLIRTLNKGIDIAKGDYIARMDADDISHPERIKTEIEFLLANPEIDIVSVIAEFINKEGKHINYQMEKCQYSLSCFFHSFLATPILHAAIIAKTDILKRYKYEVSKESIHTEDYLLWTKLLSNGIKISTINKPLYKIRINPKSVSYAYEQTQIENFVTCATRHINSYFDKNIQSDIAAIVVNRINKSVSCMHLKKGWRTINELKQKFALKEKIEGKKHLIQEINSVIKLQKIDIAIQTILKAKIRAKLQAIILLLGNLNILLNKKSIQYLRRKF